MDHQHSRSQSSSAAFFTTLANNVSSFVQHGSTVLTTTTPRGDSDHHHHHHSNSSSSSSSSGNDGVNYSSSSASGSFAQIPLLQQINDKIKQLRDKELPRHNDLLESNNDLQHTAHLLLEVSSDDDDDVDVTTAFLRDHGRIVESGGRDAANGGQRRVGVLSGLWHSATEKLRMFRSNAEATNAPPPPLPAHLTADSSSTLLDRLSTGVRAIGTRLGITPEEPPAQSTGWMDTFSHEINSWITMSKTQRMYGFLICLAIGVVLIVLSTLFLPSIIVTAPLFALFYTLGNSFCLLSTFFIVGPVAQIKNMLSTQRIIPSVVFIVSMFLTLLVAIKLHNFVLVMIFIAAQVVSLAWYILSYVPFGQQSTWCRHGPIVACILKA